MTPRCRDGRATESRGFLVYPSGVARWMADNGRVLPEAPVFAPGCAPGSGGLEIVRWVARWSC